MTIENQGGANNIQSTSSMSALIVLNKFRKLKLCMWMSIVARFVIMAVSILIGTGQHLKNPLGFTTTMLFGLVSITVLFTSQVLASKIQVSGNGTQTDQSAKSNHDDRPITNTKVSTSVKLRTSMEEDIPLSSGIGCTT